MKRSKEEYELLKRDGTSLYYQHVLKNPKVPSQKLYGRDNVRESFR